LELVRAQGVVQWFTVITTPSGEPTLSGSPIVSKEGRIVGVYLSREGARVLGYLFGRADATYKSHGDAKAADEKVLNGLWK
jgi:hypothetical protein